MNLIPNAVTRMVASQALLGRKHSPTILLAAGITSLVGSTVLACRASLKLEGVLDKIEADKAKAQQVKDLVESGEVSEGTTYSDREFKQDSYVILLRGVGNVVKLYAPAVILGGVGVICLTKSHQILQNRNAALTAAYVAVDTAFNRYRSRVVDRYGEEVDRELRYDHEEVDVIDEETGKVKTQLQVTQGDHGMYARWFDETNGNWHDESFMHHNWLFLRSQQNWANDMLMARGHLFLNEAYAMCGLPHTSAGSIVGWVYDRKNENGDNYVDFGCWDQQRGEPVEFFNGREGGILLDFNVDGPIWQLLDERNENTDG